MRKTVILVVISVMLLAACQPAKITSGILEVSDAWARPAADGDNDATYFVIKNGTGEDDVLLSAGSDMAAEVELHLSQMEGEHMSMHQQKEIAVPAGGLVEFSPGGLHVMLIGLTRELKIGDAFDLTLTFEHAGDKVVTVSVRDDANGD